MSSVVAFSGWRGLGFIGPFPRAVLDKQNLDLSVLHPVGDDIGCAGNHEFARAGDLANASDEGIRGKKPRRPGMNLVDDPRGGTRVMLAEIVANGCKLVQGSRMQVYRIVECTA